MHEETNIDSNMVCIGRSQQSRKTHNEPVNSITVRVNRPGGMDAGRENGTEDQQFDPNTENKLSNDQNVLHITRPRRHPALLFLCHNKTAGPRVATSKSFASHDQYSRSISKRGDSRSQSLILFIRLRTTQVTCDSYTQYSVFRQYQRQSQTREKPHVSSAHSPSRLAFFSAAFCYAA